MHSGELPWQVRTLLELITPHPTKPLVSNFKPQYGKIT